MSTSPRETVTYTVEIYGPSIPVDLGWLFCGWIPNAGEPFRSMEKARAAADELASNVPGLRVRIVRRARTESVEIL